MSQGASPRRVPRRTRDLPAVPTCLLQKPRSGRRRDCTTPARRARRVARAITQATARSCSCVHGVCGCERDAQLTALAPCCPTSVAGLETCSQLNGRSSWRSLMETLVSILRPQSRADERMMSVTQRRADARGGRHGPRARCERGSRVFPWHAGTPNLEQAIPTARATAPDSPIDGGPRMDHSQAFALEQCGRSDEAELEGKRGDEICPSDAWAHHAVAHALYRKVRAGRLRLLMRSP